jgi:ubiquitin-protein ligase
MDDPSLVELLACRDIASEFARCADPSVTAVLRGCSAALRETFSDPKLWATLLERFGISSAEAAKYPNPQREFARRTVCAAIGPPVSEDKLSGRASSVEAFKDQRIDAAAAAAAGEETPQQQLSWPQRLAARGEGMLSRSWSPEGEGAPPQRTPLRPIRLNPSALDTPSSRASAERPPLQDAAGQQPLSAPEMNACTVARLREGLRAIIMGGSDLMTACPEQVGDWRTWTARVTCPVDRSLVSGMAFRLRLEFPTLHPTPTTHKEEEEEEEEGHVSALPVVKVVSPRCFHPNIDPSDGTVCLRALSRRCSPVDLVGEQLYGVLSLLGRPAFDVPPLNTEAAAKWYGDEKELRLLVSGGAHKYGSPRTGSGAHGRTRFMPRAESLDAAVIRINGRDR